MSWPLVKLGDLYAKRLPSVDPSRFEDEEFDLFSVPAYSNRIPDQVSGANIGSSKVEVRPGDVLICKIVPHIRRAWVVPPGSERRQIASGEWIVLRGDQFDSNYVRHFLLCDSFHIQFMSTVAGVGGSLVRARPAFAADIDIPLPPLPEQRRIASILNQADALRVERSKAIALLARQPAAIYSAMFGNASGRQMVPLSDIAVFRSGSTPSKATESFWRGDIPWFTPKDMKAHDLWDAIDHVSEDAMGAGGAVLFPANSVAVVVRGMILAHSFPVSCLRVSGTINQDMKIIQPRNATDPQFLAHSIRSSTPTALASVSSAGHGTKRLDTEALGSIRVPTASMLEQTEFAARIEHVRTGQSLHRAHLAKLDELFASLQHRAFRGEL